MVCMLRGVRFDIVPPRRGRYVWGSSFASERQDSATQVRSWISINFIIHLSILGYLPLASLSLAIHPPHHPSSLFPSALEFLHAECNSVWSLPALERYALLGRSDCSNRRPVSFPCARLDRPDCGGGTKLDAKTLSNSRGMDDDSVVISQLGQKMLFEQFVVLEVCGSWFMPPVVRTNWRTGHGYLRALSCSLLVTETRAARLFLTTA